MSSPSLASESSSWLSGASTDISDSARLAADSSRGTTCCREAPSHQALQSSMQSEHCSMPAAVLGAHVLALRHLPHACCSSENACCATQAAIPGCSQHLSCPTFRRCRLVRELALACELMSSADTAPPSAFLDVFRRRRLVIGPSPSDMCMLALASCPKACPSLLAAFFFPCSRHFSTLKSNTWLWNYLHPSGALETLYVAELPWRDDMHAAWHTVMALIKDASRS